MVFTVGVIHHDLNNNLPFTQVKTTDYQLEMLKYFPNFIAWISQFQQNWMVLHCKRTWWMDLDPQLLPSTSIDIYLEDQ